MGNEILVMKFGGASLSTIEQLGKAARRVKERLDGFSQIVVVASAMGSMTDHLKEVGRQVNPTPPRREEDMLLTAGERISISLMTMALSACGVDAVSLTGSQSGIITTEDHTGALITDMKPIRIPPLLTEGKVVVVAGFQGVSAQKEITTLGRGGSDTTAVALAVALGAKQVEFYKDVEGVFESDPKDNPRAAWIPELSYEEALALYKETKKSVVHPRAIHLAQNNQIPLHILFYDSKESLQQMSKGSWIVPNGLNKPSKAIYER